MPVSKSQQKAVHKYTRENYDRFLVTMKPKGFLELVKTHAAAQGESTNGFINRAISETMARDASRSPAEAAGAGAVSMPSAETKRGKLSRKEKGGKASE